MESIKTTLSAYGAHCFNVWLPSRKVHDSVGIDDLVVMGYGLPGECGEVAELLAEGVPCDSHMRSRLNEELGDTIYYWACIAHSYGMDSGEFADGALPDRFVRTCFPVPFVQLATSALRLTAACGRIAEVMKKHRRDGHLNEELLRSTLRTALHYWGDVCQQCELDWRNVLIANMNKVARRAVEQSAARHIFATQRNQP